MKLRSQLRHAIADLSGRGQHRLVESLCAQVRVAREAVGVARDAIGGQLDLAVARARVGQLEGEGDHHRRELVTVLAHTMVIPIDREDLFRLSRSVDDILDDLRDFARELDLFGPEVRSPMFDPILGAIAAALDELEGAVGQLATDTAAAVEGSIRAKKRGNEVRRSYQHAIARLLSGEVSSVALRQRELLRRLDLVGLQMAEASDALADGGQKRGS